MLEADVQAEQQLSEPTTRSDIDSIMTLCRTEVLKRSVQLMVDRSKLICSILGSGFSTSVSNDDPRLQNLTPSYDIRMRLKAKEILVDEELAKRRWVSKH